MSFSKWILCILALGLGGASSVLAYQDAKVTEHNAKVHERPDADSHYLSKLKKGQAIKASSKWVTDTEGLNWYKVLNDGKFGYVLANSIETASIKRELAGIKIESNHVELSDDGAGSWSFILRAMASLPLSSTLKSIGNEFELSYAIPFKKHGIWRHLVSLGVAYLAYFTDTSMVAGTLIFRIPVRWRLQPELRFRAGQSLSSGVPQVLQVGGTFGFQYPFSLHFGAHISAYAEAGYMTTLSGMTPYQFGSVGLGFHF